MKKVAEWSSGGVAEREAGGREAGRCRLGESAYQEVPQASELAGAGADGFGGGFEIFLCLGFFGAGGEGFEGEEGVGFAGGSGPGEAEFCGVAGELVFAEGEPQDGEG